MFLILLIAAGLVLFSAGMIFRRRWSRRFQWVWVLALLGTVTAALVVGIGQWKESRQAAAWFARLDAGPALTADEAAVFRALAQAAPRLRERVIRLAFASNTNAARALPRMGFLLHACAEIDPSPGLEQKIWRAIAEPAVRKQPSPAMIRLAAATADFLRLGTSEVRFIAPQMLSLMQNETNAAARLVLIRELIPLSDRMEPGQPALVTQAILRDLTSQTNATENGPLIAALLDTLPFVDPATRQRSISEALSLAASASNSPPGAALIAALVNAQESMLPAQRLLLAQLLARGWLEPDGTVRSGIIERLPELMKSLAPAEAEQVVRAALDRTRRYSYSIFYQRWGAASAQFLEEAAVVMGPERTAAIIADYCGPVREPWSDILWARWINPLLRGRPVNESEQAARRLLEALLRTRGQPRLWFVERFSAAAARLEPSAARPMANRVIDQLPQCEDSYEVDALASCLVHLAGRLDESGANQIADCLLASMKVEDVTRYLALSRVFAPLAAKLDPARKQAVIDSLVAAMNRGRNPYRLALLAQRFSPLAEPAGTNLVHSVTTRLLEAFEAEKDLEGLIALAPGLAALGPFLTEAQGRRAGEILVQAAGSDPHRLFLARPAVEELSKHIAPDQSRRAADVLLARGLGRGGPDTYWAQKAPSVGGSLTPETAEQILDELTGGLALQRDRMQILQRARTALPFADHLRPDQVPRVSDRLLQIFEANTNHAALTRLLVGSSAQAIASNSSPRAFIAAEEAALEIQVLKGFCQVLAALFSKMPQADAAQHADRLARRFREQGWVAPISYAPEFANALQYAPAASLTNILRAPFAVGGLRQTALRALELKSSRVTGSAGPRAVDSQASVRQTVPSEIADRK